MKLLAFFIFFMLTVCSSAEDLHTNAQITPPWLVETRKAIKSNDFALAINLLNQNSEHNQNADWNNLMGYSLRKSSPPDLANSEKHYQTALTIDPKHKGALEYYGELLLMKNDLDGAESLLKRLDKVCAFGCEEYRDLKRKIQNFKSKK